MKILSLDELSEIQGGKIDAFCAGFGAVAAIYGAGLVVNLWNPVGWTAGAAAAVIGLGCAVDALR